MKGFPPAAPDIEAKVRAYVTGLAKRALPQVRGYHAGGTLDVRWGGDVVDNNASLALLLFAALDPNEVGELVIKAIVKEQPLSALEHGQRVAELEGRIDSLSYQLAAMVERNGGEFDVELKPEHVLGVRLADEMDAAVA